MFAIIEINNFQYKIKNHQKLFVNRLKGQIGENITFNKILIKKNENNVINIGNPTIQNEFVKARILNHIQDNKVIVFKKKKRKGYKIKHNHRQKLTQIQISSIS